MNSALSFISCPVGGTFTASRQRKFLGSTRPKLNDDKRVRLNSHNNNKSIIYAIDSSIKNRISEDNNDNDNYMKEEYIINIEDEEEDEEIEGEEEIIDGLKIVNIHDNKPIEQGKKKKERSKINNLIESITTQPDPNKQYTVDADTIPNLNDDENLKYIKTIVESADLRKASNILCLRVTKITYITCFIILITGNNAPQLRAISNLIEENLTKQHSLEPQRIEGVPNSGWLLLDYGDFIINVFSPEQRKSYNLERLWNRAEVLDISEWLLEPTENADENLTERSLEDWIDP